MVKGSATSAKSADAPTFVARDSELSLLAELQAQVLKGRGAIVVVQGEAGIGKSRLIEETVLRASTAGLRTSAAAASELDRHRPFGVLADCLEIHVGAADPKAAEIAELIAGPDPETAPLQPFGEGAGLQSRVIEEIIGLVERISSDRPTVISVEDIHWADPSTLLALHRLSRYVPSMPLMLILSRRPLPKSAPLDELMRSLRANDADHLELGALDERSVNSITIQLVGAEPSRELVRQVSAASGNPLFVTELIRALQRHGAIDVVEGRAVVAEQPFPPSLALAILDRLSFLNEETTQLLRLCAILGTRFAVRDLSLVSRRPATELVPSLQESLRGGVLEERGDRLQFRHELIQRALLEDTPEALRRALHTDVGEALANAGHQAEEVATHLLRGANGAGPQTIAWVKRAVAEAAPRAPAVATALLEELLSLLNPLHPDRDALIADLVASLAWAGRLTDAESLCREVLGREHDPALEGRFQVSLNQALISRGAALDALAQAESAVASGAVTGSDRLRLIAWAAYACLFLGDRSGAIERSTRVLPLAREAKDDYALVVGYGGLALANLSAGRLDEALSFALESVRIVTESTSPQCKLFAAELSPAMVYMELDRLEDAWDAFERQRVRDESMGTRIQLFFVSVNQAWVRFLLGEWEEAQLLADTATDLGEDLGDAYGWVGLNGVKAMLSLHRGDLTSAEVHVSRAEAKVARKGPEFYLDMMLLTRGLLLGAVGRRTDAWAALSGAWQALSSADQPRSMLRIAPDVIRAAVRVGESAASSEVAREARRIADMTPGIATAEGTALLCHGLANGRTDALLESIDAFRRGPRPLDLALALEDAAAAVAADGASAQAKPLFEEALDIYEKLRASHDIARAASRMRSAGIRRSRRVKRVQALAGWEALTESERKVAALVAEGLSNPQIGERLFISRHTVHTHVSHILAKLAVSSRAELAVEASKHQDAG